MAAKGTDSKNAIFAKLQEVYPDAFWEDTGKILRVPMDENGVRVEIKVTLTAAKANIGDGAAASAFTADSVNSATSTVKAPTEPTEEEKNNVAKLIASLGL